jgi:hypothetical protein
MKTYTYEKSTRAPPAQNLESRLLGFKRSLGYG